MSILKKGLKTIKNNKNIILAAALALISAVTVIYAYFSKAEVLPLNYLGSGNIEMNFEGPDSVSSYVFEAPGDTYEAEFTVENIGMRAFTYKLGFNLTSSGEDYAMEKAVLVYFDGEYYGTLFELMTDFYDENYAEYDFVLPRGFAPYLYMKAEGVGEDESATHTLKLEYHIGGAFLNDSYFDLTIDCDARSLTEKNSEFVFVKDWQLSKLLPLINDRSGNIKTVVLCGNAYLNNNLTITKGVNIDLNGYTLDLKGKTLSFNFADEGLFSIYDRKNSYTAGVKSSVSGGGILINTPNAAVVNKTQNSFGNAVFTQTNIGFTVTESGFKDYFIESIRQKTKYGIADDFDYIGDFAEYVEYYMVKENSDSSDNDLIEFDENLIDVVSIPDENVYATLTLGFQKGGTGDAEYIPLDVKVLGVSGSIIYKIEEENKLPFRESVIGDRFLLKGDLFLPKKDNYYCDLITWISSRPDILTADGKFIKPYSDTELELSAVYSVNGQNIIVSYYFTAQAKTIQEKIDEVAGSFGSMYFIDADAANFGLDLPLVGSYTGMGFDRFEFEYDENDFDIKEEGGFTKLIVVAGVESLNTQITIRGFIGEENAASTINVYVDIEGSESIFDAAFRYVRSHLSHIEEHTFDSFPVPSYYVNGQTVITYELKNGPHTVESTGESYRNPADVIDEEDIKGYIKIIGPAALPPNKYTVKIDKERVPPQNTQVYIEVTVTNSGISDTRLISFNVTGVLHCGEDIQDVSLFYLLRKICDADFDFYITADEAESVTQFPAPWLGRPGKTVNFNNCYIRSLAGLEYFVNLTSLDLNTNIISDLSPLSQLYNLSYLNLQSNQVIDIVPLSMLVNLTQLNLRSNSITDIQPLENIKNIERLYLQSNVNLGNFQVLENFEKLRYLDTRNTLGVNNPSNQQENINYVISAYMNGRRTYSESQMTYNLTSSAKWKPSDEDEAANQILNSISLIYEFADVLYLPDKVNYNDSQYNISWSTYSTDIISIDPANHRAYITQPVSSVDVQLKASILYPLGAGGMPYNRVFNVLSRQDKEQELYIEVINDAQIEEKSAFEVIPDSTLRYYLFKHFDADAPYGTITRQEISTYSTDTYPLNFAGLGIKSIEGLQHFYGTDGGEYGINYLDLRNNYVSDISPLEDIATLKDLLLNGYDYNYSVLNKMKNLISLKIFGCKNVNSPDNLSDLYEIYKNNQSVKIYKDSLSAYWNPYLEPLALALKSVKGMYALSYGEEGKQELDANAIVRFYDGETAVLPVSYTPPAGQSYIKETVEGIQYIKNSVAAAEDKYQYLTAEVTYQSSSVTARISVVIKAETDILVEWRNPDTETIEARPLYEVVKNKKLKEQIAALYNGSTITRSDLCRLDGTDDGALDLRFDYRHDGMGLRNLYLFYGINLNSLTIYYFSPTEINGTTDTLTYIDNIDENSKFPHLTKLSFNYCVVNIYDLVNIKTKLTELYINNCADVVLKEGEQHDSFAGFTLLSSLTMINSNISDFTAIETLDNVTYLAIYDNPASTSYAADDSVNEMYKNLSAALKAQITYYVTASNVPWTPEDISYIKETITDFYVEIRDNVGLYGSFIKYADYGAYNPNYDIGNGYRIRLPKYITVENGVSDEGYVNLNPEDYPIAWTITATDTILPYNPDDENYVPGDDYDEYEFDAKGVKAYIVIKGNVTALGKEIIYVFVVDGTNDPVTSAGKFNIENFMEYDDNLDKYVRFYDPIFAYRVLTLFSDSDNDGVFNVSDITGRTSLNLSSGSTNGVVYNVIQNIKGISCFTNLQALQLQYNQITDISELYDLTKLQSLYLYNNPIKTLWLDDYYEEEEEEEEEDEEDADVRNRKGVFDKMHNLRILRIHDINSITDYRPIAQRKHYEGDYDDIEEYENYDHQEYLQNLSELRVYCGTNLIIYNEEYYKYKAVKKWWQQRSQVVSATTNLYLFRNTALVENATTNHISDTIKILDALAGIGDQTVTTLDPLPEFTARITLSDDSQKPLTWQFLGSQNIMTITGSAETGYYTLASVTTECYNSNHKVPMKVYVNYNNQFIGKIVYLNMNFSPSEYYIEVTYDEYRRYDALYKYQDQDTGAYYVKAAHAVPDGMLMNALFGHFNKNGDNIISLAEREDSTTSTTFTVANRGVTDITGIELFNTLRNINFTGNFLTKIPLLPIYSGDALQLNLASNVFLRDLEGYDYVYQGDEYDENTYTSLRKKVTKLQINSSSFIDGEKFAEYLSKADTILEYLDIRSVFIVDFNFLLNQIDNLEYFSIGQQFRTFANGNVEFFKKFFFNSVITGGDMGISSNIITDYIKLHEDYRGVYSIGASERPLPDKIFFYGEEYGIEWIAVSGQPYTIGENGIITLLPTTALEITVIARVYSEQAGDMLYSETLTFKVNIGYQDSASFDTEATWYDGQNLAYYVPDMIFRQFIIAAADTNPKDTEISQAEVQAMSTTLNINITILSLKGIELFSQKITALTVNTGGIYDFSPIAQLKLLTTLTISGNLDAVDDFSFILGLDSLQTLTLSSTQYTNLSFAFDMVDLNRINSINGSSQDLTSHIKNAVAYAQSVYTIREIPSYLSSTNVQDHFSTADEREAALILSQIDGYFSGSQQYKGFLYLNDDDNEGEGYSLLSSVVFKEKEYDLKWLSLSSYITIGEGGYTFTLDTENFNDDVHQYFNIDYIEEVIEYHRHYSIGGIACMVKIPVNPDNPDNGDYYYYFRYWHVLKVAETVVVELEIEE